MRAFVALVLPAVVRAQLAAVAESLHGRGDVRWVAAAQLHVTLKFLGEIDGAQADALAQALARPWPAFRLQLQGLGSFPERGAPRVLWAGLAGDTAMLAQIAADLDAAAAAEGIAREDRPFRAHVTLGRCRSPRGAARLQAALRQRAPDCTSAPFVPEGIALFRSDLGAAGSTYVELRRAPLSG